MPDRSPAIKSWTESRSLSGETQWALATGIVSAEIDRADRTSDLQVAAAGHIDAATYALERLLIELSAAMPVPGRTPAPVVHRIEPAPLPQPRRKDALAA